MSGGNNTSIGENAGNGLTTGGDNTFIGTNAGKLTTTGDENVFVADLPDIVIPRLNSILLLVARQGKIIRPGYIT